MKFSCSLCYLTITSAQVHTVRDAIVAGRARIVAQSGSRAALSRRRHSL
jgi:hypothetical protein